MKIILTSIMILLFLIGWAFLAGASKLNEEAERNDPMAEDGT